MRQEKIGGKKEPVRAAVAIHVLHKYSTDVDGIHKSYMSTGIRNRARYLRQRVCLFIVVTVYAPPLGQGSSRNFYLGMTLTHLHRGGGSLLAVCTTD